MRKNINIMSLQAVNEMQSNAWLTFDGELLLHLLRLSAIEVLRSLVWTVGSYILQILRLLGVEWFRHFDSGILNALKYKESSESSDIE